MLWAAEWKQTPGSEGMEEEMFCEVSHLLKGPPKKEISQFLKGPPKKEVSHLLKGPTPKRR